MGAVFKDFLVQKIFYPSVAEHPAIVTCIYLADDVAEAKQNLLQLQEAATNALARIDSVPDDIELMD
jgi:hypothetical protein